MMRKTSYRSKPRSVALAGKAALMMAVWPGMLAIPGAAQAQQDLQGGAPRNEAAAGDAVARLALSQQLFVQGQAYGDALTVLAAARLAASVRVDQGQALTPRSEAKISATPSAPADEETEALTTGPDSLADPGMPVLAAPDPMPPPLSPAEAGQFPDAGAMFARALALAGQDDYLGELIVAAQAQAQAQAQAGAAAAQGTVAAYGAHLAADQVDHWQLAGKSGEGVAVLGHGGAALEIAVRDASGIDLCRETGAGIFLYCAIPAAAAAPLVVSITSQDTSSDSGPDTSSGLGGADYTLITGAGPQ
ncbi:hypothetical protein HOY34_02785 [Xinfangfangia sp. D13-10-4-6]|uniref:hypothetical protein n=1 Tax=Pseudogemmobacter hezensis TaxID=2737662 RepID=UPI0015552CAB|nr:hypothetical protein [Pseudogemmobacter hezensis]NPD14123.1 hypothetical protein [Pseudogemmobacter hezensis]